MAIIPQSRLFSWKEIEGRSDLDRLRMVLGVIPDEGLMRKLEGLRGKGRDDYPVRAVWNCLLAGVVYEHPSVACLRRELLRNGELRQLCGFDPLMGASSVPSESAYTRFLRNLFGYTREIGGIFDELVDRLGLELPDLGRHLAIDSKAIRSAGKPSDKGGDGRRERVQRWFGYKLHLVVDTVYELSLGYGVSRASVSDTWRLLPMVEGLGGRHGWILERAEDLSGDKAYDSENNNRKLYDDYGIKPIIDIRHAWKDGEQTRPLYSRIGWTGW